MQDKELDLADVLTYISKFLKQNLLYFAIMIVLGLAWGFYNFSTAKTTFKTDVYAKAEFLPLELLSNEILTLNRLVKNKDLSGLKKVFDEKLIDSTYIDYIKYTNVNDKDKFFLIQLETIADSNYNEAIILSFRSFLSENNFISEYMQKEENKLRTLLKSNQVQLKNMELIFQKIISEKEGGEAKTLILDPGSISNDILKLETEIIDLRNQLERFQVFNIVDVIHSSKAPSLFKELLSALLLVLFVGTFLLLVLRFFQLS